MAICRDYPFSIIRLELEPPGILVGRERNPQGNQVNDFGLHIVTMPGAAEAIADFAGTHPGYSIQLTVPISDFYRLLAKVAHSFTAAVIGYGAFRPAPTSVGA